MLLQVQSSVLRCAVIFTASASNAKFQISNELWYTHTPTVVWLRKKWESGRGRGRGRERERAHTLTLTQKRGFRWRNGESFDKSGKHKSRYILGFQESQRRDLQHFTRPFCMLSLSLSQFHFWFGWLGSIFLLFLDVIFMFSIYFSVYLVYQ